MGRWQRFSSSTAAGYLRSRLSETGVQIGTRLATDRSNHANSGSKYQPGLGQRRAQLFDVLAPGFALLFLMYTVSLGGKSLLTERQEGTLARLMTTPIRPEQVLVGKMTGTYMIGLSQMMILIGASAMLLGLALGKSAGAGDLVDYCSGCSNRLGHVAGSSFRNPGQVSSIGMAMTLLFGLVGGSFFGGILSGVVGHIGMLTPNYWGQKGFNTLAQGGNVQDLLPGLCCANSDGRHPCW